jgi:arsenate reductase-like glutaredoxin family protein
MKAHAEALQFLLNKVKCNSHKESLEVLEQSQIIVDYFNQQTPKITSDEIVELQNKLKSNTVVFNHMYRVLKVLSEEDWKECLQRQIDVIEVLNNFKGVEK